MTTSAIGLSSELFAAVFPFHLAFNHDLQLVQLGTALQQICPGLIVGDLFEQHFHIAHPIGSLDLNTIQQQSHSPFLLTVLTNGMKLKGQMLYVPEHEAMLFLGTPWITDMADLVPLGLKLTDFAIHDLTEICRALEKEQELDQMKSRFITNTSHKFRTPLGIISSSAGILQDYGYKANDELRQKHLLRIQSAVQHITALLEDVLLLNRLEQEN